MLAASRPAVPLATHERPPRRSLAAARWALPSAAAAAPLALHALHLDLLVAPLLVVGLAGLLPFGATTLDRLMLSALLWTATLPPLGLLLSVWPWHLRPLPVALLAATPVAVLGAVRSRWAVPVRFPPGDAAAVLGAAATAAYLGAPLLRGRLTDRLAMLMIGEDNSAHLALMDTVRRVGGYPFLHRQAAGASLPTLLQTYPQGTHLDFAVLANLAHRTSAAGAGSTWIADYADLVVITYAGFTLVLLWSVARLAGRDVARWPAVPAVALATSFCVFGPFVPLLSFGFASQLMGLALLTGVLAAATSRGLAGHPLTGLVILLALTVGLSYVYYFLTPVAAAALLAWLVGRRRAFGGYLTPAALSVGAAVIALVPVVANRHGSTHLITATGPVLPPNRGLVLVLLLGFAVWVLVGPGRPATGRIVPAAAIAAALGTAVTLGILQTLQAGHTSYYFEKALTTIELVGLLGSCALVAEAVHLLFAQVPGRRWQAPVALLCAAGGLAAFGVPGAPVASYGAPPSYANAGEIFHNRVGAAPYTPTVMAALPTARRGRLDVYWGGLSTIFDYRATKWSAVLERQWTDRMLPVAVGMYHHGPSVAPFLARAPVPVRIVATRPTVAAEARAHARPGDDTLLVPR